MADKQVCVRLGCEWVLTLEEAKKLGSKWVPLFDKDGRAMDEGELCTVRHEFEDGEECTEDGEPLN